MPIINPSPGTTGPQGPQGIPGINGIPGFDGESGEDGLSIPGSAGPAGANGSSGVQGVPGVTVFVEDGLNGEDSFIPGPQGIQGIQGTNGTIGRDGARGFDGEDGLSSDDLWPGFNVPLDDPLEQISRIQDQSLAILPNNSVVVIGPYTINTGKTLTLKSGGRFKITQGAPNTKAVVFASQTTNVVTSFGPKMTGLANGKSTQLVTPKASGVIFVTLGGDIFFTNPMAIAIDLYYGTGTPPVAGSSVVPPLGSMQAGKTLNIQASATISLSFSISVVVVGLSPNVTYWFDISTNNQVVDIMTIRDISFVAIEL